ncbi:MAG: hypothetical protein ACRDVE_04405 [Actinocrinis sp.]
MRAPDVNRFEARIRRIDELLGALPEEVCDRIHTAMFEDDAKTAAALRVLAVVSDRTWYDAVGPVGIDWAPILSRARLRPGGPANSDRCCYEIAASLAGHPGAHVQLRYAATVMARHTYLAVLDALRIAVEGVEP